MTSYNSHNTSENQKFNGTSSKKESHSMKDDNYLYAASATDMTGLAPTVAHNEYEAQSYEEVFPYLPPAPPTSGVTIPDVPISEGIHAEYRKEVTRQNN